MLLQVCNLQFLPDTISMKYIFFFSFCISSFPIFSQTSSWQQLCKFDQRMIHSSGILTLNEGQTFWTQVDNSSPEEIYEINQLCQVLRTLKITNASKTDWEDIAHDDQGTIYIGDFGNNNNNRNNLKIYILKNVDQHVSDTISAERITFSYANQNDFPPEAAARNFDMEAMIWYNDSLHLFSKNRTDPFTGFTYHYIMPDEPGDYKLLPVDSFKTGDGPMVFFWITGAAINRKDSQLILLSHDRIWMFSDFEGSRFFQGTSRMITLPSYSQKEGICYANENIWYLTDEYFPTLGLGGNLYEMKLEMISALHDNEDIEFKIYPNPVKDFLQILTPDDESGREIQIFDFMGKLCKNYAINKLRTIISTEELNNGIYFIKTISKNLRCSKLKKVIVVK
jgi:hypothetical protein